MSGMQKRKNKISTKIRSGIFILVLLPGFWVPAQAQINSDATGDKYSAHIKRDKDADTAGVSLEQEISTQMPIPGIQFDTCEAFVTLQYHQRNTLARVEASIENESCPTSNGEYELSVNLVDDNGVSRNLSFSETWELRDDAPVIISRDYPIGENVTLKRVVAQRISCECAEIEGPE